MIWAIAAAVWFTLFAGIYLLLSRNLLRSLIGLLMLSGAINLVLFASGRVGSILPPVIGAGQTALSAQDANPLPQALVLTAIVIAFAMTAVSIVIAIRSRADHDSDHVDGSRAEREFQRNARRRHEEARETAHAADATAAAPTVPEREDGA